MKLQEAGPALHAAGETREEDGRNGDMKHNLIRRLLAGVLAAVLLYWGILVLAIHAWQWSDPVTW